MTTTTITPVVPLQLTTDVQNNALSLQLLTLYASPETVAYFRVLPRTGQPIPTFASFARGLTRLQN